MKKISIFYVMLTFLLIYFPPLFAGINTLHIVGGISWVLIIINFKYIKIGNVKELIKTLLFFCFFIMYIYLVSFFNKNPPIQSISSLLFILLDIIPAAFVLSRYFKLKKYTYYDILSFFLLIGMIQALFSIFAFFIPEVQNFFIGRMLNYGYSDVYSSILTYRLYGFSSTLTYTMPIVQTIFSLLSIYMSISKNYKYIFLTPVLFFSAIINARISIVIFAVGIVLLSAFIIFEKKNKVNLFYLLMILVFSFLILVITSPNLDSNEGVFSWIEQGFKEITLLFSGEKVGYFNYLNDKTKFILPENNTQKLFGTGINLMYGDFKYMVKSDVGYVNNIWYGGIFYTISTIFFFISSCLKIFKKSNYSNEIKYLSILFITTFIVSNIKGVIFGVNDFMILFIIFYMSFVINNNGVECLETD